MPGVKRSRSGAAVEALPEGCPTTCPVGLWKELVIKGVWDAAVQEQVGPGPWEIRSYQGPSQELIGAEQYTFMRDQYKKCEKRRIQMRLKEIERYTKNKPWVGPSPSPAELVWWTYVQDERRERREKRRPKPLVLPTDIKVKMEDEDVVLVSPDVVTKVPDLEWQDPYTAHTQVVAMSE